MTTATANEVTTPPDRPPIHKTVAMREVEVEHRDPVTLKVPDIRDLIINALRAHPRNRDAAHALGLFPPTLSHWIPRLGIWQEAQEIQRQR